RALECVVPGVVDALISSDCRDDVRRYVIRIAYLTRFVCHVRDIALSFDDPPSCLGYPPSVFAALPRLMERAGQSERGSITALYTVLVEGDDMSEPVADETRSILDGHIVLSRKLAAANHYPAIDVLHSVSRVMNQIVDDDQRHAAGRLREWLAKYEEVELLLKIGEYQKGQDSEADRAIEKIAAIRQWLRQGTHETSDYAQACAQLRSLCA
ncbi:EscN/YscN/HrcN family type III secretion system ATPase, partial [Pseudomonas aeruginosa]|nr:EscN/YscN/HrcN family type III secretion system ATPase [Pseudomonas aeruginosa]